MVNDMMSEGKNQRVTHPVLSPEVRWVILEEEDEAILELTPKGFRYAIRDDPETIVEVPDRPMRDLWRERGLSKADMEFNLKVMHIWDIACWGICLVRPLEEKYHCSRIMALSLGLKKIERYKEETRRLLQRVRHAQDKEVLHEVLDVLDSYAGRQYRNMLLGEAQKVDAIRARSLVDEGRVSWVVEDELIEARFALDAIWDGEASTVLGTTEHDRRLAKKLAPKLHSDPKVVEARRSLGIDPGGFQDLDAAHQWALQSLADPLRRDDYFDLDNVIWWESYAWDSPPAWDAGRSPVIGRGYIMLDLPAMKETLEYLVRKYQLASGWYRVLPLCLIRGRLEPPPRVKWRQTPMKERDELLTDLVDEYGYELAQVIFNGQLAAEEVARIMERHPEISPEKLYMELGELAERRNSWLPKEKQVSYDGLRKIVSRTRARRAANAKYEGM